MQTIQQTYTSPYTRAVRRSLIATFFKWCQRQEEYRFGWLATILATHGCIITPITLLIIFSGGGGLVFLMLAMIAMGMSLVSNLAAMPTKITIPVYFLSILIDLILIGMSIPGIIAG